MVGYYYKTGSAIYAILRFMKDNLDLEYKSSPSGLKTGEMHHDTTYRFSFFLNERKEIVYLIESLADDTTDYFKEEKPMTNMTKEEALKKIEELKAFVEKLDEEIPEMIYDVNSTNQILLGRHMISFNSLDTRECYRIKAFELAHLMYAREHICLNSPYKCNYQLYFDVDDLEYDVIEYDGFYMSDGTMNSVNHWLFPDEDSARKVANYMNKYVKDTVKEMY